MTIDEQIEQQVAAYRAIGGFANDDGPEHQFRNGIASGIEIGRMEALRSLYVEVKPDDCKEHERYWIDMNEDLWEAVFHLGKHENYFICTDIGAYQVEADEVSKILKLSLPSPSSIFGEGV